MSDRPSMEPEPQKQVASWSPIRFERLAAKELRETLRDRRTIITLFLMPVLVYPLLSLLLQGFLISQATPTDEQAADRFAFVMRSSDGEQVPQMAWNVMWRMLQQAYQATERRDASLATESEDESLEDQPLREPQPLDLQKDHDFDVLDETTGRTLEEEVAQGHADVGIDVVWEGQPSFTFVFRDGSVRSLEALAFIKRLIDSSNLRLLQERYAQRVQRPPPRPIMHQSVAVAAKRAQAVSFAALVPLILTLMTMTGAVYPAIDLTAGERERGTLESLMAAPVPRIRILLGKLAAVVLVAMLTAVLNLIGMSLTIWVFQLDTLLFGEHGLKWYSVIQVLGLLVLFSGFFASVLLVITSFARSFKEGQAYLIPLMLLALAPSVVSLNPDLKLQGLWSILPLVNIVLLARDVLSGSVALGAALTAIVSTVFYAALAITTAARFFGTPQVLYGQAQGISTLFARPKQASSSASASLAMLCLALLFPTFFVWQGVMGRVSEQAAGNQVALLASGIFLVFFVLPFAIARFHRVRFLSGFRIRSTHVAFFLAAIVLGVGAGPLLIQLIAWSGNWIQYLQDPTQHDLQWLLDRAQVVVDTMRQVPFWAVLLAYAVVPAVVEELFFRGLLFQSLIKTLSPAKTILATAIMFGLFHLISGSGLGLNRLLPTTLMGIVLGIVCWRSGSVLPGMLLHGIHNAMISGLAYYERDLVSAGWVGEEQAGVPVLVQGIAAFLFVGGAVLLAFLPTRPSPADSSG